MKYNILLEIPLEIRDFYKEEIKNEKAFEEDGVTPIFIDIEYEYIDINGEAKTGIRKEQKYIDNTYIVEKEKFDLKNWNDVSSIINIHKGSRDDIVDYFIEKAIESDKWDFHNKWSVWNKNMKSLERKRDEYIYDEESGDSFIDYNETIEYWETKEPTITTETVENWKLDNFRILRKPAYGAWHEQFEMQVDRTWEDHVAKVKIQYPSKSGE